MRYSGSLSGQATASAFNTATRTVLRALLLPLAVLLVNWSCGLQKSEAVTLARPVWECPSPPAAEQEKGINASPSDDFVHARWLIGTDPDLDGYFVHRRKSTDLIDTLFATVYLTPDQLTKRGSTLEWIDRDTRVGGVYYYVLFAFDRKGNRSARSDTVGFGTLEKPMIYGPVQNQVVTDSRPVFQFGPRSTVLYVQSYVVRVVSDSTNSQTLWVSPRRPLQGYTAGEKTAIQYGSGGFTRRAFLGPGKYRWRVDFQGSYPFVTIDAPCGCVYDTSSCPGADSSLPLPEDLSFIGSQSAWVPFTVTP